MRKLLIILFYNSATAQDYIMKFKTVGLEPGVVNYQPQISKNLNGTYATITTIAPKKLKDSNIYTYTIVPQLTPNYYRVKALLTKGIVYTNPIKIVNTNVIITNAVLKIQSNSDNLSFNATVEGECSYYSIEKSTNSGSSWSIVGKLTQRGLGRYVVNVTKSGTTRSYRVRGIYKSGIVSEYVKFIQ